MQTTTLSQIGLADRWGKSAAWVRSRGERVTWNGETWARMEYSTRRLAGYKLVTVSPPDNPFDPFAPENLCDCVPNEVDRQPCRCGAKQR